MAAWEQFEVRIHSAGAWELLASFSNLELAAALACSRSSKMRLVQAVYEDGKLVSQETLADLGMMRKTSG